MPYLWPAPINMYRYVIRSYMYGHFEETPDGPAARPDKRGMSAKE